MNTDNCDLKSVKLYMIDGSYHGDIKEHTRIQHGRGIYIDKKNASVYEGWRFQNKREIYGRLIDGNGLIYKGQFKNNIPHGRGEVK